MPIIDSNIREIKCDGPGCTKAVIYDRKDERVTFENPDNIWLKSTRVTQTADGRNLVTCSDLCEVESVRTGKHNIPEQPKVAATATAAEVSAAVAMAQQRAAADAAIREGGNIKITDN